MLPSASIIAIALHLVETGVFEWTTPPLEIAKVLEIYQNNGDFLKNLTWVTNVTTEDAKQFLNRTVACLNALPENTNASASSDGVTGVLNCFSLAPDLTTQGTTCIQADLNASVLMASCLLALVMVLLVSLCHKRQHCLSKVCWGRPGAVIPLNMLDSYENRHGYALAFGVTVVQCLIALLGDYKNIVGTAAAAELKTFPPYTAILIKLMISNVIALAAYPLFLCQTLSNKIFGCTLGVLYCFTWLSVTLFKNYVNLRSCFEKNDPYAVVEVLKEIPFFICLSLLLVKFIIVLVVTFIRRRRKVLAGKVIHWLTEDDTNWKTEYMYLHVKNLLIPVPESEEIFDSPEIPFKEKMVRKFKSKLYEDNPHFKYSTRVMSSMFVALLALYAISIMAVGLCMEITDEIENFLESEGRETVATWFSIPVRELIHGVRGVGVSLYMGVATAFIFSLIMMGNMLKWYRIHILKLRKGDRSWLPGCVVRDEKSPGSLMAASLKFAGYQVAYCVWGSAVSFMLFSLIYLIIVLQVILPIAFGWTSYVWWVIKKIWAAQLVAIAVMIGQYLLARFAFLIDGDTLAVNNRKFFHNFSYFMFFFNVIIGLFSCLLRVIVGMLCGIIFLPRLQKSSLPRSFEKMDPGFMAYLGYILLEHQHANPVLYVFSNLLLETTQEKKTIYSKKKNIDGDDVYEVSSCTQLHKPNVDDNKDGGEQDVCRPSKARLLARNRWHLAVTLIRNPSLKNQRSKKKLKIIQKMMGNMFVSSLPDERPETSSDEEDNARSGILTSTACDVRGSRVISVAGAETLQYKSLNEASSQSRLESGDAYGEDENIELAPVAVSASRFTERLEGNVGSKTADTNNSGVAEKLDDGVKLLSYSPLVATADGESMLSRSGDGLDVVYSSDGGPVPRAWTSSDLKGITLV